MLSHASRFTGLGFAVLVGGFFVVPGCGGDDLAPVATGGMAPVAGTGGSGTAGTSAGTATGGIAAAGMATGGAVTGGAGMGGAGTGGGGTGNVAGTPPATGGTPQVAATCKGIVPTEALISNFDGLASLTWGSGTADTDFSGGMYTYPTVPITLSIANDNLTATGNVATYSGFGLYVTYCGNASSFAGVKFKISGDAGESGNLLFHVQTNQTKWADGQKGTCLGPKTVEFTSCVPPTKLITGITAVPKEVTILWTDVTGGKPVATTDGSDIIGFNWSFTWPAAAAYAANIIIDDMEFVSDGAGAGGAGAGGSGAGGAP